MFDTGNGGSEYPNSVMSSGGNLPTPTEALAPLKPNYVGNIFFGGKGFLVVDHEGFKIYKSSGADISGEAALTRGYRKPYVVPEIV